MSAISLNDDFFQSCAAEPEAAALAERGALAPILDADTQREVPAETEARLYLAAMMHFFSR